MANAPVVRVRIVQGFLGSMKMGVPQKIAFLIGFSIINHPFWRTSIYGNPQMGMGL
jgi:hypothetical protein